MDELARMREELARLQAEGDDEGAKEQKARLAPKDEERAEELKAKGEHEKSARHLLLAADHYFDIGETQVARRVYSDTFETTSNTETKNDARIGLVKSLVVIMQTTEDLDDKNHAFDTLVPFYLGMVFAKCAHAVDDESEIEDLAQEVFISAYESIGSCQDPKCFSGWLQQIAKNECKDHSKSTHRRKRRERKAAENRDPVDHSDPSRMPATVRDMLVIAKEVLTNKQYVVTRMVCIDRLSHSKIANVLGISREAVTKTWGRAKDKILNDPRIRDLFDLDD